MPAGYSRACARQRQRFARALTIILISKGSGLVLCCVCLRPEAQAAAAAEALLPLQQPPGPLRPQFTKLRMHSTRLISNAAQSEIYIPRCLQPCAEECACCSMQSRLLVGSSERTGRPSCTPGGTPPQGRCTSRSRRSWPLWAALPQSVPAAARGGSARTRSTAPPSQADDGFLDTLARVLLPCTKTICFETIMLHAKFSTWMSHTCLNSTK